VKKTERPITEDKEEKKEKDNDGSRANCTTAHLILNVPRVA
jgi:hypothetical protein